MKIIKFALIATAPLALAWGSPAVAQDGSEMAARMAQVFTADPLTAEQEARLPAAERVVGKIFPPGTYMKMMDESMKPMMDAIMAQVGAMPVATLVRMTGLPEDEISGLGEGTLAEMMAILDPAYEQRQKVATNVTFDWMGEVMDQMEPSFRTGLSRAYAVRFSEQELTDLSAFFATPTGANYAEQSMLIMMDPQVMATMSEMMPALMDSMPGMMREMQSQMESLPPARRPDELSDEERAKLADLLGIPPEDL